MREILFRGKSTETNQWIYGGFHIWEKRQTCLGDDKLKDDEISCVITVNSFADWNMPRTMQAVEVIPETVGQFTGVTDKNGKRVFEGDIFQYEPHFTTEKACLGIVKYRNTYDRQRACNDCGFVIEWQHEPLLTLREDLLYWCGDGKSASVIGNIHDMNDNPELFEE